MFEWIKIERIDGKRFLLNSMNIALVEDVDANSCVLRFVEPIPGQQPWESSMHGMQVAYSIDAMQDILNGETAISTDEMLDRR